MKAIIVFILFISSVHAMSKCNQAIYLNLDPHCGILPDCNLDGPNPSYLKRVSCERKENGKPGFIELIPGKCLHGKPRCSLK
uniref:Accessory gland protein Acp63F n=3 Tax=Drosophila melanogaster TaxID=7227 RepID=A63F_DROME|eukprot:NP_001303386.1 accessory gland protein 63F, isoform B [Drosophila melanogaster]